MVAKISPNMRDIRTSARRIRGPYSATLTRQLEEFVGMLEEIAQGKDLSEVMNTPGFETNTILENYAGDRYVRVKDLLGVP